MGLPLDTVIRDGSAEKRHAYNLIARRVIRLLDERELTQTEVSRRTGISMGALQGLLRGTTISVLVMIKVAVVLGVTVDDLIPAEVRA